MKTMLRHYLLILLLLLSFSSNAQRYIVSGTVSDDSSLLPLHQISVVDNKSGTSTITNADGHYSVFLSRGEVALEFAGMGFDAARHSFVLNRDTVLDVRLAGVHFDKGRRMKRESYRNAPLSSLSRGNPVPEK